MQQELKHCPICKESLYSELGEGCLMCGMSLEEGEKFCSEICEVIYIDLYFNN